MAGLTADICRFRAARSALNLGYDVLVVVEESDDGPGSIGDTGRSAAADAEGPAFLAREK